MIIKQVYNYLTRYCQLISIHKFIKYLQVFVSFFINTTILQIDYYYALGYL